MLVLWINDVIEVPVDADGRHLLLEDMDVRKGKAEGSLLPGSEDAAEGPLLPGSKDAFSWICWN